MLPLTHENRRKQRLFPLFPQTAADRRHALKSPPEVKITPPSELFLSHLSLNLVLPAQVFHPLRIHFQRRRRRSSSSPGPSQRRVDVRQFESVPAQRQAPALLGNQHRLLPGRARLRHLLAADAPASPFDWRPSRPAAACTFSNSRTFPYAVTILKELHDIGLQRLQRLLRRRAINPQKVVEHAARSTTSAPAAAAR